MLECCLDFTSVNACVMFSQSNQFGSSQIQLEVVSEISNEKKSEAALWTWFYIDEKAVNTLWRAVENMS